MQRYSVEPRARKYIKWCGFLPFARKYKKQLLLDSLKTTSKKVVHKTGELLWNKIADALNKSNDHKIIKPDENLKSCDLKIIPLEKRDEILTKKNISLKSNAKNIVIIKRFNCIKICDEKMNRSKLFIKPSIFC